MCGAHEPADLTSREGGRMERQPHLCPLPNMCSVFWVASRAATRSLHAAPAAVTGESGKMASSGSCTSDM